MIILGAILLVAATLFGVPGLLDSTQTSSATVNAGASWVLQSVAVTSESAHVKWHGGVTTTHTYLVTGSATPSCSSPTGVVATGAGKGGSFSSTFKPGKSYQLFACSSGATETLAFSVSISGGVSKGEVWAIVLTVFGLPMVLLGVRGRYPRTEEDDE